MLLRLLASGLLFVGATAVMAEPEGTHDQSQGQAAAQKLTLDDLKAKCRELSADPQRKPITAKVTCSDLSNRWDQTQQGKGKLPNGRKTGAQIDMKGYVVTQQFFNRKVADTEIACPSYVKIEKVVDSVEADISCADLLKLDDLSDFCANLVDQRVAEDAGVVKEIRTNEVKTLCPN